MRKAQVRAAGGRRGANEEICPHLCKDCGDGCAHRLASQNNAEYPSNSCISMEELASQKNSMGPCLDLILIVAVQVDIQLHDPTTNNFNHHEIFSLQHSIKRPRHIVFLFYFLVRTVLRRHRTNTVVGPSAKS
jgi:hypothetical protein